jgi:ABC-type transport system substrate-binding protein
MIYISSPPYDAMAQVVQQELGDIGLKVALTPVSSTDFYPAWRSGSHQSAAGTIVGDAESSITVDQSYLGVDNPGTKPPELAQMANAGKALPIGSDQRNKQYQQIGDYLVQTPIHVPIAQFAFVYVTRPNVIGSDHLVATNPALSDFRHVGKSKS